MAAIRYMATPNQAFSLKVYDGDDALLEEVLFIEFSAGLYRANTTVKGVDLWGVVLSGGENMDMIRIEPRMASFWQMPDALNVWRFLGLK